MLPGKKYTPEDILRILWRHRWFALVPFAVISAGTAVYARMLPDRYLSESLIMVVPQRVPESYVRSTVTTRVEDRLVAITEQIMSRTRLERVILEFDLYAEQRRTGIMQDIVERMQREVTVRQGQGDTFRVGFVAGNPVTARKVAEKITSLFIDESLRQRENLAEGTNQFLEAQLQDAETRLIENETRLEAYRRQYGAELPSQLESNLQAISNVQMQIQQLLQAINQNQNIRLALERQLTDLEAAPVSTLPVPAPDPDLPEVTGNTAAERLAQGRALLDRVLDQYTPAHPEAVRWSRIVEDLEAEAEAEALQAPLSGPGSGLPPAELARQQRIAELNAQLQALGQLIAAQQNEERRLRGEAVIYQQRVEATPTRETEMISLTRDYSTLQEQYSTLLGKREDAKISANLERRQIGEQFEVLDPARLPERPFSPNRERLNYLGMAAGLGIGLALVALLEYRDRSFRTDDEVKAVLSIPVLAVVPHMQSKIEKRRTRYRSAFVSVVLGTGVLGCLAVLAYTFVR